MGEKDYCPIKTADGKCGAGGKCDYVLCWEKMHYNTTPESLEQKMLKWKEYRRREVRWRDKK